MAHLERAGYSILDRNYRAGRLGELDIVAADDECIVFCEVKTRVAGSTVGPDGALDGIGLLKRKQVRQVSRHWLRDRASATCGWRPELRFDAIGITLSRAGKLLALEHVEAAF